MVYLFRSCRHGTSLWGVSSCDNCCMVVGKRSGKWDGNLYN